MTMRGKTLELKENALQMRREGVPIAVISRKLGISRATVRKITEEPEEYAPHLQADAATTNFDKYEAAEAAKIEYVGQIAKNERSRYLLEKEFEKAGLAIVDAKSKEAIRIVSDLLANGWKADPVALSVLQAHLASLRIRQQKPASDQSGTDDAALQKFYSVGQEILKYCSENNTSLRSFLQTVSDMIECKSRGMGTADIAAVNSFVKKAASQNLGWEELVRDYIVLQDLTARLAMLKTELERVNKLLQEDMAKAASEKQIAIVLEAQLADKHLKLLGKEEELKLVTKVTENAIRAWLCTLDAFRTMIKRAKASSELPWIGEYMEPLERILDSSEIELADELKGLVEDVSSKDIMRRLDAEMKRDYRNAIKETIRMIGGFRKTES